MQEEPIGFSASCLVVLAILAMLLAGPGCSPASAREPLPVVTGLDALHAQVTTLAERTSEAVSLGAACKAMCLTEPAQIRSLPNGRLECDCRALPSLGVHRVSRRNP